MSDDKVFIKGALFFTDGKEQPIVHGYIAIAGQEFTIAGWQPDIPFTESEFYERHIRSSAGESDTA